VALELMDQPSPAGVSWLGSSDNFHCSQEWLPKYFKGFNIGQGNGSAFNTGHECRRDGVCARIEGTQGDRRCDNTPQSCTVHICRHRVIRAAASGCDPPAEAAMLAARCGVDAFCGHVSLGGGIVVLLTHCIAVVAVPGWQDKVLWSNGGADPVAWHSWLHLDMSQNPACPLQLEWAREKVFTLGSTNPRLEISRQHLGIYSRALLVHAGRVLAM
jgi:hypothetical protein